MWNKLTDKIPPFDTLVLCRGYHDVIDYKGVHHGKCPHLFLAYNHCYPPSLNMIRVVDQFKDGIHFGQCPNLEEWMEIPD